MSDTEPLLVLVVEDSPSLRELLGDILRDAGYTVLEAQDGLEAVQLVDGVIRPAPPPCVMLLDLMLPRLDGLGVLRHLHEHQDDVPVVAMSASGHHLRAAAAEGAAAILPKPFAVERVVEVVEHFCHTAG
jgi:two-component system chemotaxis response regulator CheY